MRLAGKVTLITGGASGIGLAMAHQFGAEGATLALVDRAEGGGQAALLELQAAGYPAQFIHADLAAPAEIEAAVSAAVERWGRLDVVVNNAGVILPKGIEQVTAAEWDWLMAVNLRAPFLVIKAALPALQISRGTILNIGSVAALRVTADNMPYCTSKGGLITLTKCLALDLYAYGIRVNCLCPGAVDTSLIKQEVEVRGLGENVLQQLRSQGTMTTPAQLAAVALYLVSDEAAAITGSIILADAGVSLF